MTTSPTPEDISRPDRIDATKPLGEDRGSVSGQTFQSYMQREPVPNPLTQQTTSLSPFDLAHGQTVLPAQPTVATLLAQASSAQSSLGDLSNQLSTPNLKLKQAHKYLLRNKLQDANQNLRAANAKMGAEIAEETPTPPGAGPVHRFLNFVSDGQTQLDSAIRQLNSLKDKKETLTPGDFLLIQLKLNKAQQEIEYSSVLLSKVIDDMKMLMNVQL